jgi:hypothetical protein
LLAGALKGDSRFLQMVLERVDGKVPQQMNIDKEESKRLTLRIESNDDKRELSFSPDKLIDVNAEELDEYSG